MGVGNVYISRSGSKERRGENFIAGTVEGRMQGEESRVEYGKADIVANGGETAGGR